MWLIREETGNVLGHRWRRQIKMILRLILVVFWTDSINHKKVYLLCLLLLALFRRKPVREGIGDSQVVMDRRASKLDSELKEVSSQQLRYPCEVVKIFIFAMSVLWENMLVFLLTEWRMSRQALFWCSFHQPYFLADLHLIAESLIEQLRVFKKTKHH